MIVWAGIPSPGRGVASVRIHQPAGLGGHRGDTPPAAHPTRNAVEVGEGGVAFGVHNQVHVLGPADHPQFGHRLVRRYDQFHPRPLRRYQTFPGTWMAGTTRPVDRLVILRGHSTFQTEDFCAGASPGEWCLTPRGVIGQRPARIIVTAFQHRGPVVLDRLPAHHPHPGHGTHLPGRRSPLLQGDLAIVFLRNGLYQRGLGL
jgi:hypothetical protein